MCAQRTVAMGVWGHAPPRKFLSFRRSEIDCGAFWDTFFHAKAGAVEAAYEWSGSGTDPGLWIEQAWSSAREAHRSGGMPPQEIFEF